MKKLITLSILLSSLIFTQDRSIIFNTGTAPWTCASSGGTYDNYTCDDMCDPGLTDACIIIEEGFTIGQGNSVAERFTTNYDYAFEAFGLYIKSTSFIPLNVTVKVHSDDNNSPGESLGEWIIPVNSVATYYSLYTGDSCVDFMAGGVYWLSVNYIDDPSNTVTWLNAQDEYWYTSTSDNSGVSWDNPQLSYGGAGVIYAERIYESDWQPSSDGDINDDGISNILDIVGLVGFVLNNVDFTEEQQLTADMNIDGLINILDIVQLVNFILYGPEQMPLFSYEDINPASNSYGQYIGPESYSGNVSLYYFGKAG